MRGFNNRGARMLDSIKIILNLHFWSENDEIFPSFLQLKNEPNYET